MHHAGIKLKLRRPKGAKGRVVTDYLTPADAAGIITAAESFDHELAFLLRFLLYTGARLGEVLQLRWDEISIEEMTARIRMSKNGDPRAVRLRADLCEELTVRRPAENHGRVFRFHQGGWLKERLLRAKLAACGLPPVERPKRGENRRTPPHRLSWVNFHTFRHTYATWMRRYGGLDEIGLVATGNWRDPRSARRYAHNAASDSPWKIRGVALMLQLTDCFFLIRHPLPQGPAAAFLLSGNCKIWWDRGPIDDGSLRLSACCSRSKDSN
jgi:integrase